MKNFLKSQFKFSIFEITLAGLFVALNVISEKFISIKIPGLMSIGITYVWYILMGLAIKPFLAIVSYMVSDLINTGTSTYGFVGYMWEYPVMYIGLILLVFCFKFLLKIKNAKVYWMTIVLLNASALVTALVFLLFKSDFQFSMLSNKGHVIKTGIKTTHNTDLTDEISRIVVWVMMSLALVSSIVMFTIYYFKRNERLKLAIFVYTIVLLIIIVFNWIFEPIVYIRMLERNMGGSYGDYYSLYLTARVAKSPILFVLYTSLTVPLYLVFKQINKTDENKW